ncbi:MAG TPA: long-chain fatty acid--CoA ligase [Stellaceae bacterium]
MARIWEQSYPPGISWSEPLPAPAPLENMLADAARGFPDVAAIDFYDRIISYRELLDLARRAAKGFQALGVGPGVQVALHLPNSPHFIICFYGILMAGGRVVPFSPLAAPRELGYFLKDSEAQVIVTLGLPTLYPQVAALKGKEQLRAIVVCALDDFMPAPVARAVAGPPAERVPGPGTEIDYAQLIDNDGKYVAHPRGPLADEIACLVYTGGTTGEPKGAMLTHANFRAVVDIRNRWLGDFVRAGDEKTLMVLPLFHIFGLGIVMQVAIAVATTIVLHLRFDAERALADIAKKRITVFPGVPTMFTAMVNHPRITEFDLTSLRQCGSGGAPLPMEVMTRFKELTGITPAEGYGLTETAPIATFQRMDEEPHLGSVGIPAPLTSVEIVDLDTGLNVLAQGERGEICITGPSVMKGYWHKPDATEEAFRGGRFHTGDIGYIDAAGYLTIVDRKKDLIISGGFNVFPRNIEEAIYEHPGVAEVTVIGVPDAYRGQSAKAFIALKAGAAEFSLDELKRFLADRIAKYEVPTELEFRPSLPKTAVGKLSKKELVAEELAKRQRAPAS